MFPIMEDRITLWDLLKTAEKDLASIGSKAGQFTLKDAMAVSNARACLCDITQGDKASAQTTFLSMYRLNPVTRVFLCREAGPQSRNFRNFAV